VFLQSRKNNPDRIAKLLKALWPSSWIPQWKLFVLHINNAKPHNVKWFTDFIALKRHSSARSSRFSGSHTPWLFCLWHD
jgi:hypothetical protein